jgi:hypothetical protein
MWLVVLAGFGVIALKVESVLAGDGWQDSTRIPVGQGRHPRMAIRCPAGLLGRLPPQCGQPINVRTVRARNTNGITSPCRPADSAVALVIAGGQG